jgi:hypothetical protein
VLAVAPHFELQEAGSSAGNQGLLVAVEYSSTSDAVWVQMLFRCRNAGMHCKAATTNCYTISSPWPHRR